MTMQIRPHLILVPLTRQCRELMQDMLRTCAHDLDMTLESGHLAPEECEATESRRDVLTMAAGQIGGCIGLALQTHNPPAQPRDLADLVMQEALMLRQAIDAHDHDATASALVTLQHLVAFLQREHMSPHEQETLCPEWDYSRGGRLHWINHHEQAEEV